MIGRGFEPSLNREKRNGEGSTMGFAPVTRSAARRPAAGPMPKPWPEKPVDSTSPGIFCTGAITGTQSGVVSIRPAHFSATLRLANERFFWWFA